MKSNYAKHFVGVCLIVFCLIFTGCGPREVRAPESDVEAAKALLTQSLEQWKAGKRAEDLRSATPPVFFADDSLAKGVKLRDFRILSNGEMYVTNVKFEVELQFEGSAGETGRQSSIEYLVTTVPAQTISRLE